MELTTDQATALARFREFRASGADEFALVGYAGTGKSWLTRIIVEHELAGETVIAAAPSHKACEVLKGFLGSGEVMTVSAISGERMASREADAEKEEFVRMAQGKLKSGHGWVLIDEISMVRRDQYEWIKREALKIGARLIVVGDPAQLKPVSGRPVRIGTKTFPHHGVLRQVVRSDDALSQVGMAIREGLPWKGEGVRRTRKLQEDFLKHVEKIEGGHLSSVYLAWTNAEVAAIQQAACQQLYGHGCDEVRTGECVRAENTGKSVRNAEVFCVGEIRKVKDKWGETVFDTGEHGVLVPFSRKDVVLREALSARDQWGAADPRTRKAWAHYYHLIQRCQLFSHPYAMTIHKSQGSTFDRVWCDIAELRDTSLAYVAATRASVELTVRGTA